MKTLQPQNQLKLALTCFQQDTKLLFRDNRPKSQVIQPTHKERRQFWPAVALEPSLAPPPKETKGWPGMWLEFEY